MTEPLLGALAQIVGEPHVITAADVRAGYERDWTGRWTGTSLAVVRPAATAEVVAVVRACAREGVAVVTQGGNTGLVGGGVPAPAGRQIVLSTLRLAGLGPVDTAIAQLPAGAGATLAAAQQAARSAGLDLALDLAARDTATLGGLVACDAGGLRALRHGTARRQLAGIEAVLADGTVVSRMSGLLKDVAGYDLGALLVGSEGTLGIITAVRWSLAPRRDARAVALIPLGSVADAVALVGVLRPRLPSLEVCELMVGSGLALSAAHLRQSAPVTVGSDGVAVVLECAAATDPLDELVEALDAAGVADDAIAAADAAGAARLMALRESLPDAIAAEGIPVKFDVGVPLARLAEFCERVGPVVQGAAPRARPVIFGHLADGNLHVNVLGVLGTAKSTADSEGGGAEAALDAAVLALVADCGGTIAAEHGIGRHKPPYLTLVRSAGEIAAMRALKRALDPAGILNPGVGLAAG